MSYSFLDGLMTDLFLKFPLHSIYLFFCLPTMCAHVCTSASVHACACMKPKTDIGVSSLVYLPLIRSRRVSHGTWSWLTHVDE